MTGNPNPYYINQSPASLRTSLAQDIGTLFAPLEQTPAELAAGVTPVNFGYPAGDLRRYGAIGGPYGSIPATDDSGAWATAVKTGYIVIPQGFAFKIVTGTSYAGQLTLQGSGPTSQLYCDTTILTNTGGNSSLIDNLYLGNITAPWLLLRNPASWATVITTLTQSSTANGYQPTGNDPEYTSQASNWNTLYGTSWSTQNIGPLIAFSGASSGIMVSRIYGRFVNIQIQDAVNATVRDCNFRAGKGSDGGADGAVLFDNLTNGIQTGVNNRALNNVITYASNSAISFSDNTDFEMSYNHCGLCGESGIKLDAPFGATFTASVGGATTGTLTAATTNGVWTFLFADGETRSVTVTGTTTCNWTGALAAGNIQTAAFFSGPAPFTSGNSQCFRGKIQGNRCYENYYDGIDVSSTFPPTDTVFSWHQVTDNYAWNNRSTGMDIDGRGNQVTDNYIFFNGTYGIWASGLSNSNVSHNHLHDNNQQRNASYADLNLQSIFGANTIDGNDVWGGTGQNNYGIYSATTNYLRNNVGTNSAFFYGLPGAVGSVVENNNELASGLQTDQSFVLVLQNTGGTLQHAFYADLGAAALGNWSSRVIGATATLTNTPTGADSSTAFANGGKIGSANTNWFILNTANQQEQDSLLLASIEANSTGTALRVQCFAYSENVNGVTQYRVIFQFSVESTDAAFALTTANIAAGKYIKIKFLGKIA